MTIPRCLTLLAAMATLSACAQIGPDKGADTSIDSGPLTNLQAGIWVDPEGCDHWIIDDGVEGYLMARLHRDGTPVCSGQIPPNVAYGPFRDGEGIRDLL